MKKFGRKMALKLTWVNHASFIISDGIVSIISDPWLEGTAFNDGWKLLSPTVLSYEDFKNITHIWFSHEHPDHFAPMVIKKIPVQYRQNITVLYQNTIDRKVIEFCKKQGFKSIIEIKPKDKIKLSPTMTVSCQKVKNETDSWMLIETPGLRILNLNDCHFHLDSRVKKLKRVVGDIDILFTQFSYAQWVGNHDQTEMHKQFAQEQLVEIKRQFDIIKPKIIVPFASYVWFCHEENYFMNASVNHIKDVYNLIPTWGNVKALVFYPGDIWDLSEPWIKSESAIERYENDLAKIISSPTDLIKTKSVSLDELKQASEEFRQRCIKDNNVKKILSLPPFTFYLTDYSQSFRFSYLKGMEDDNVKQENADVSLSSQAMWYCFKNDWGLDTLCVSGRFEKPIHGNFEHVEQYQWVADLKNIGKKVPRFMERVGIRLKQSFISD